MKGTASRKFDSEQKPMGLIVRLQCIINAFELKKTIPSRMHAVETKVSLITITMSHCEQGVQNYLKAEGV